MNHQLKQIHHALNLGQSFIIVPHQNPDGDALGSATALAEYLMHLNKPVQIFVPAPIPKKLAFLPHLHLATNDPAIFEQTDKDTIVVLDSGDLAYAGIAHLVPRPHHTLINIDHHATNQKYGRVNLVVPNASATSQIIFYLFKQNRVPYSHQAATALLTGLVGDTENFTNQATGSETLAIGGELMRGGANLKLIGQNLNKNKTPNILKLWGVIFSRLTKVEKMDLVYTYMTRADVAKYEITEDQESEGIANYLNNLGEAKIILILKEAADGKIKGSLRTTKEGTDVSLIARKLGGGGHKKAAGFTADGTIESVLKKILQDG